MRVIISVLIFFTGYTVNAQDTIIEKSTSYYVVCMSSNKIELFHHHLRFKGL